MACMAVPACDLFCATAPKRLTSFYPTKFSNNATLWPIRKTQRHFYAAEQIITFAIKMTSLRPFHAMDIFKFNSTNLDPLTETYELNFYFSYLARWPHLFNVAEGRDGTIDAYSMYLSIPTSPRYHTYKQIIDLLQSWVNLNRRLPTTNSASTTFRGTLISQR